MDNQQPIELSKLVNKTTDVSLIIISLVAIPLNIVVFFALEKGEFLFPRIPPFILTIVIFTLTIFRKKIPPVTKKWMFISLFFATAMYCLILGLIDMAGLWFLLMIMYVIMSSDRKYALRLLIASLILTFLTGFLLMAKIWVIPLNYDFRNCEGACIMTRTLHYIIISSIVFYILSSTIKNIRKYVSILEEKNRELNALYKALEKEMQEKKKTDRKIMETIIQTEEKERKRIATDLHDGIGQILSTTKLYFQAFKDTENETQKQTISEKIENVITNAINTVSEISHNLSPGILQKHGLVQAIKDFIEKLQIIDSPRISFAHNTIGRFDSILELSLYRVICELINNTLKYAKASNIELDITLEANKLYVQYNDNGTGFSMNAEKKRGGFHGMGLQNIRGRIRSLNGEVTIDSQHGKGMKAEITIPINNK